MPMKSSQSIRVQHSCAAVVSNEDYQYLASAVGCEALPMKSTQIEPFSAHCKRCAVEFNRVPNTVLGTDTLDSSEGALDVSETPQG